MLTSDKCLLIVIVSVVSSEDGIVRAVYGQVLSYNDAVIPVVLVSRQLIVISDHRTVGAFRNRINADHHAIFRFGAVVGIVGACPLLITLHGIIMYSSTSKLRIQCFQLCHVDSVRVLRPGCHVGNLTGQPGGGIAYGNSGSIGLPGTENLILRCHSGRILAFCRGICRLCRIHGGLSRIHGSLGVFHGLFAG